MTDANLDNWRDNGPDGCKCGWFHCGECFPILNRDWRTPRDLMDYLNR